MAPPDPRVHHVRREPGVQQLAAQHDAVLAGCQDRDPGLRRLRFPTAHDVNSPVDVWPSFDSGFTVVPTM
jgi:hypothetical protein